MSGGKRCQHAVLLQGLELHITCANLRVVREHGAKSLLSIASSTLHLSHVNTTIPLQLHLPRLLGPNAMHACPVTGRARMSESHMWTTAPRVHRTNMQNTREAGLIMHVKFSSANPGPARCATVRFLAEHTHTARSNSAGELTQGQLVKQHISQVACTHVQETRKAECRHLQAVQVLIKASPGSADIAYLLCNGAVP